MLCAVFLPISEQAWTIPLTLPGERGLYLLGLPWSGPDQRIPKPSRPASLADSFGASRSYFATLSAATKRSGGRIRGGAHGRNERAVVMGGG